jgi:hypothetical protein
VQTIPSTVVKHSFYSVSNAVYPHALLFAATVSARICVSELVESKHRHREHMREQLNGPPLCTLCRLGCGNNMIPLMRANLHRCNHDCHNNDHRNMRAGLYQAKTVRLRHLRAIRPTYMYTYGTSEVQQPSFMRELEAPIEHAYACTVTGLSLQVDSALQ